MATRPRGSPETERRRLFRRMEWLYVYLPPLLIAWVGLIGGALLAWLVPLADTTFWQRWLGASLFLILAPLIVYLLTARWRE